MLVEQLEHLIKIGDDVSRALAYLNEHNIPFSASLDDPESGGVRPLVYELVDNGKVELAKHLLKEEPELAKVKALTVLPSTFHNRLCSFPLISALIANEQYSEEVLFLLLSAGCSLADEIDGPFGKVQVWQQLVFSGELEKLERLLTICPPIKVTSKIDNCTVFEILGDTNADVLKWQETLKADLLDKKAKILQTMRILDRFKPLKGVHKNLPDLPEITLEANASADQIAALYETCLAKMGEFSQNFSLKEEAPQVLRLKIALQTFVGVLDALGASVILLCQQEQVLTQHFRDEVKECLKVLHTYQQKRDALLALSEQKNRFLSPPTEQGRKEEEEEHCGLAALGYFN